MDYKLPHHKKIGDHCQIELIPNKGRGVIASVNLDPGTLLFAEDPLITFKQYRDRRKTAAQKSVINRKYFKAKLKRTRGEICTKYRLLTTHSGRNDDWERYETNCFDATKAKNSLAG